VPSAPSNYKDQDKIAAYIAEKQAEVLKTAALDPDYGKIISISMTEDIVNGGIITIDEATYGESVLIEQFWKHFVACKGVSCGYNIIGFDLPYLMRRFLRFGDQGSDCPFYGQVPHGTYY